MDTPRRSFRFDRWWGLALGVALAAADTVLAFAFGFRFEVNGRDATFLTGAWFGSSLALLGFAIGWLTEVRRRDREQAAVITAQVEELAAARARLAQQEKLAALGQLATAIAHEVRNPLAVIRSAAQGLAETERPDGAAIRHATTFVIAEIDRLTSVVTALLAFARPRRLAARVVAVDELFDRALLLAREDLDAKRVRVTRDAAIVPALAADPDLLCQVLLGLLANAVEAVPVGGEVGLAARTTDARTVEIDVTDSGPGVPAEVRGRVFEPFFTTRARGTGLGLAVAQQIVEAHGGTIAVGDRPGGGARFTLRIPTGRAVTEAA
jgi:signal transduction histidine kinase